VLETAHRGDVASVCAAVESFGEGTLPGTRHWLKVAGGPKSEVLEEVARRAPIGGVAVEVGTYCGYSSARFAAARAARGQGRATAGRAPSIVTVEVDLAHAVIARNVLMFAGVAHEVETLVGHSEDVLPWLAERMREKALAPCIDFAFLDQRGSRYTADLASLEQPGCLKAGAIILADNVLKPGAPLFLWNVSRVGGGFKTEVKSLSEFAMSEVEDWMTISTYHPEERDEGPPPAPPQSVRALEWKAEQMRARAHQPDYGGSGIGFSEWAKFAEEMRHELQSIGLAQDVRTPFRAAPRAQLAPR